MKCGLQKATHRVLTIMASGRMLIRSEVRQSFTRWVVHRTRRCGLQAAACWPAWSPPLSTSRCRPFLFGNSSSPWFLLDTSMLMGRLLTSPMPPAARSRVRCDSKPFVNIRIEVRTIYTCGTRNVDIRMSTRVLSSLCLYVHLSITLLFFVLNRFNLVCCFLWVLFVINYINLAVKAHRVAHWRTYTCRCTFTCAHITDARMQTLKYPPPMSTHVHSFHIPHHLIVGTSWTYDFSEA